MAITRELFEAFIRCKYKAHQIGIGESGLAPEYPRLIADLDREYRGRRIADLTRQYDPAQVCDAPASLTDAVARGDQLIVNASATSGRFSVVFDALERGPDGTGGCTRQYVPLLFLHREKVTRHDRLIAAFLALALSELLGTPPTHAKIVHGREGSVTKVMVADPTGATTAVGRQARRLLNGLATRTGGGGGTPPPPNPE